MWETSSANFPFPVVYWIQFSGQNPFQKNIFSMTLKKCMKCIKNDKIKKKNSHQWGDERLHWTSSHKKEIENQTIKKKTNTLIDSTLSNQMSDSFESSKERRNVQILDDEEISIENFNELTSKLSKIIIREEKQADDV